MSTVEQTAREKQLAGTPGTKRISITAFADEHLTAIDDLVHRLQNATSAYHDRALDWGDVASLRWVREHLSRAVEGFTTAEAAAELSRAAREVATEVRQFRGTEPPTRSASVAQ